MPVFVHLTSERNLASIRRQGIGAQRSRGGSRGVYAMPVTPNFQISHQWLRELKRWGAGTLIGVYFRLADDVLIDFGPFNDRHRTITAAEAVSRMMNAASPLGYEAIVRRRIDRSEILRIKSLPQIIGWRYMPNAHGHPPFTCRCCERGFYGAGKLLREVEQAEIENKPTKIVVFGRSDASYRRVERLRKGRTHR